MDASSPASTAIPSRCWALTRRATARVGVRAFLPGAAGGRGAPARRRRSTPAAPRASGRPLGGRRSPGGAPCRWPTASASRTTRDAWPRSRIPTGSRPRLSGYDLHLLGEGTHYRLYDKLGAHPASPRRRGRRPLRGVGAQRAAGQRGRRLERLGRADGTRCACTRATASGSSSCRAWPQGARYKYEILGAVGRAARAEDATRAPSPSSPTSRAPPPWSTDLDGVRLGRRGVDGRARAAQRARRAPCRVYEVHLGSWRRMPEDGDAS